MRRGADRGSWKNPRPPRTPPANRSRGCDGMADPEDKKGTAGSADAKPAPKRRIRAPKAAKPTKAAKAARATQEKETKREAPAAKPGQVHVYSLDGEVIKTVELPAVSRFPEDITLPVVIEDGIETLTPDSGATREGLKILNHLGLLPDVERAKDGRHIRAGRGKMRGRRYRQPRSVLVVVKEAGNVRRLLGNLPGVEVVNPAALNAEVLAPGGDPGRLTVFSEGALEILRSWPT